MVINHNISALNTYNKLQANENNTTSSLEKLSSGLRINKAADDAAGLAISQKMQAQINGLDTASDNSQNGISLIQTGEGALSESQSILQRMNELAVQASNGVNGSDDVKKINDEVTQLQGSLNEISEQTTYNTKAIFSQTNGDGLFNSSGITLQVGAAATDTMKIQLTGVTGVSADNLGVGAKQVGTGAAESGTINFADGNGSAGIINFEFNDGNGVDETVSIQTNTQTKAKDVGDAVYASLNQNKNVTADYNLKENGDGSLTVTSKHNAAVNITATETGSVAATGTAVSITPAGTPGTNATLEKDTITLVGANASSGTISLKFDDGTGATDTVSYTLTAKDDDKTVAAKMADLIGKNEKLSGAYGVTYTAGSNQITLTALTGGAKGKDPVVTETGGDGGANATISQDNRGQNGTEADYTFQLGNSSKGGAINFEFTDEKGTDKTVTYMAHAGENATSIATGIKALFDKDTDFEKKFTVSDLGSGKLEFKDVAGEANQFSASINGEGTTTGTDAATYTQATAGVNDKGLDFSTTKSARSAIETIKSAISTVSSLRSQLGAFQNKLTHTINNLSTESANLTSASSQITDVDMAKEMTSYTKNNILVQSAEAMLAQANQLPQGVLSLLK